MQIIITALFNWTIKPSSVRIEGFPQTKYIKMLIYARLLARSLFLFATSQKSLPFAPHKNCLPGILYATCSIPFLLFHKTSVVPGGSLGLVHFTSVTGASCFSVSPIFRVTNELSWALKRITCSQLGKFRASGVALFRIVGEAFLKGRHRWNFEIVQLAWDLCHWNLYICCNIQN